MLCAAILFDMDGVLVDSMPVIRRQLREWADRHCLSHERVLAFAHGRSYEEVIRGLVPSVDLDRELAWCVRRDVEDLAGIGPCPGAHELLAAVEPTRWAIVTSGYQDVACARLRAAGIPSPQIVVSADDVRHAKPDPEGYLLAASRLGVPPSECLVIEDAPAGVRAGLAAGCRVIAIAEPGHPGSAADSFVNGLSEIAVRSAHSPARVRPARPAAARLIAHGSAQ